MWRRQILEGKWKNKTKCQKKIPNKFMRTLKITQKKRKEEKVFAKIAVILLAKAGRTMIPVNH